MNDNKFSVMDMAQSYSEEHNMSPEDLFKPEPIKEKKSEDTIPEKPAKKPWKPDDSLLEGMAEMTSGPVTYAKDEIKVDNPDKSLKDITDEKALDAATESMDDMQRKLYHIEMAKKRFGIKHLQIPDGPIQTKILTIASDPNTSVVQKELDKVFQEIIDIYPLFIKEWADESKNPYKNKKQKVETPMLLDVPEDVIPFEEDNPSNEKETSKTALQNSTEAPVQILIDKTKVPEISWTKEELEKLKHSRTFELNIVEEVDLPYSQIKDADDNVVDTVLSQYVRKANDVAAALPASKYRATFTGLSYTEIMDLSYSHDLNNLDGEKKRWSIAYQHIKNPSIGSFTDFEDFLKKTSYLDLEFILWKILCATSMDKELITIDCHGTLENGAKCDRSYEWIYSPNALLDTSKINVAVLDEMKKTGEAASSEDIQKNYKESMLNTNNSVELPSSKFRVVFGHISAYTYLNEVYPKLIELRDADTPIAASQQLAYSSLQIVKAFLIPQDDGTYIRIKGMHNLIRVLNNLNEIDWQTILELVKIMIEPYTFSYVMKDIVCPQCKTKSDITIDRMDRMLFLVIQSLAAVNVTLKRS